jgi:hypothetical protein
MAYEVYSSSTLLINFIKDKMSLLHWSIFIIETVKFLNNNLITKIL